MESLLTERDAMYKVGLHSSRRRHPQRCVKAASYSAKPAIWMTQRLPQLRAGLSGGPLLLIRALTIEPADIASALRADDGLGGS